MDATSSSGSHVRSTSWSEDINPLSRAIEDHLSMLNRKEDSAFRKLKVLRNMYEVVDVFLGFQTTKTRKACTGFEDVSEGFLDVLDICNMIRDVLMEIKEHVRELESSLRRRLVGTKDQESFFDAYVFKRRALSRTMVKQVKKTEENMKNKKKKKRDFGGDDINAMKKVEKTSFNVLVSLLMEVVNTKKIYYKKRSRKGILWRILPYKENQETDTEEEMKKLRETENEIEETEKELEYVYKKLVKIRVSLLNMLTL